MIIEEWRLITKEKEADIMVIDMPLLDTRIKGKNLVGKFICDIVLQVLSFVAQNERETMRIRQAEGIKTAKARGVKFGRPRITLPANYETVARQYLNKEITNKKACKILGMTRASFFRYFKELNIN
jgi:DNA invertase Pin-like site-specific DNA recombinase